MRAHVGQHPDLAASVVDGHERSAGQRDGEAVARGAQLIGSAYRQPGRGQDLCDLEPYRVGST